VSRRGGAFRFCDTNQTRRVTWKTKKDPGQRKSGDKGGIDLTNRLGLGAGLANGGGEVVQAKLFQLPLVLLHLLPAQLLVRIRLGHSFLFLGSLSG
jgi:hypothetical protein